MANRIIILKEQCRSPDNLDAPARTMLTSESGVSRTTHVIEDYKTKN